MVLLKELWGGGGGTVLISLASAHIRQVEVGFEDSFPSESGSLVQVGTQVFRCSPGPAHELLSRKKRKRGDLLFYSQTCPGIRLM